jgi:hypothetical protein
VFILLTAVVGGLFRADLSSLEAINKKYAPYGLLAWASAASMLVYLRPRILFGTRPSSWLRPLVLCSTGVALIIPGDWVEFRAWRDWERSVKEAATVVATGIYSENLFRRFYYDDRIAYDVMRRFMNEGVYCFREMPPVGYPLNERFHVADDRPRNLAVPEFTPAEQNGKIQGFIVSGKDVLPSSSGFPSIVVADSGDRVTGYGNISSIAPGGMPAGKAKVWFAAIRLSETPVAPFRIYAARGNSLHLVGLVTPPVRPPANIAPTTAAVALQIVPDHRDFSLELFNGVKTPLIQPPVQVLASEDISLSGLAVDREAGTALAALQVVIDGKPYPADYGLSRPDVAAFFKQPAFTFTGFSFKLPAATVGIGQHQLRLRLYTNAGKSYLDTLPFPFVVRQ